VFKSLILLIKSEISIKYAFSPVLTGKTIVKEGEIGLIGEPEKIFEEDMLEKRSFDNFNFYILR
ncbi:MAG: hypothetical protein ABIM58_04305, partial [candidate division WOR-3 bacterium]